MPKWITSFGSIMLQNKTVVSSKSWLHGAPGTTIEELEEGNIDDIFKVEKEHKGEELVEYLKKRIYKYRIYGTSDYERLRTGCGSSLAMQIINITKRGKRKDEKD